MKCFPPDMSEFKFACPVCGQHIKCDSSQAGTVMDCPTCFQKINVPQAPAGEGQKFILTGTQVTDKPVFTRGLEGPAAVATKKFPAAAVAFLVLLGLSVGAGVYFFGGKILHLHSNWQSADIGNVGLPGTFSEAEQTLSIGGSGKDIWDQTDAFHYVYRAVNGDVSLTVHVADMQRTDPWAKAGLMVRESLTPDSPNAAVFVTADNGVEFQQRTNAAATATTVRIVPHLHAPHWVRLTRQDSTFTAETSADGAHWKSAGSTNIAMKSAVYAGLAVTAHNNNSLCQATFDHAAIVTGSAPNAQPKSVANPAMATQPPAGPVAPPANDTNWMLVLGTNDTPESQVVGRIHGQDFIAERVGFQNGSLTFRYGTKGSVEFGAIINFSGALAEELTGKTINVTTNVEKAAKVTLRWTDDTGTVQKPVFDNGYALRLEFGLLVNNHLPGKIYLCLPDDEKSYLMGSFVASVSKPKPKNEQKPKPQ